MKHTLNLSRVPYRPTAGFHTVGV